MRWWFINRVNYVIAINITEYRRRLPVGRETSRFTRSFLNNVSIYKSMRMAQFATKKKIIIIMQGMVDTQGVTKECSLVALLGKLVNGVQQITVAVVADLHCTWCNRVRENKSFWPILLGHMVTNLATQWWLEVLHMSINFHCWSIVVQLSYIS